MGVSTDRAAKFPHPDAFACLRESFLRASELIEHQRQLQTERDRFGVNAMAAADHRCLFVSSRLFRDCFAQFIQIIR